jgi:hypothetical protein
MFLFFITTGALLCADSPSFPRTPDSWLGLLNSDIEEILEEFGGGFSEMNPEDYSSRAQRIIYYSEGLTLWSVDGEISQCRLDSAWTGRTGGVSLGMSVESLRQIMGPPWIEELGSLYYNLPWDGGPVRLRFVYNMAGLTEIYLYKVR